MVGRDSTPFVTENGNWEMTDERLKKLTRTFEEALFSSASSTVCSAKNKSFLIMGVKSHSCIKIGQVYSRRLESVGVCQKEKEGENGGQPRPVGSMILDPAYA